MKFLKVVGKAIIPTDYHDRLHNSIKQVKRFGVSRYCPCCKAHLRRFEPFGLPSRPEARCPLCGSLERHRLGYLYLRARTDLFNGQPKKVLHVAPELPMSRLFQSMDTIDYLSADLSNPKAMVKVDIANIQYPDHTFDVIYCSHVLEHVQEDRKAMAELSRVLKAGGWAILQVPIGRDGTFEDPSVTSPEERRRLFGTPHHVRIYGKDYKDRLEGAGFSVTVDGFVRQLGDRKIRRFGLRKHEDIYFCHKKGC